VSVGSGRISLLIDSPLRTLAHLMRGLDSEVKREINVHTKTSATPIWAESTRGQVVDRLQTRVLADTARVGVTSQNVFLRSGGVGTLSSGTPVSVIARAVEFGADPNAAIVSRTKAGKTYKRRRGRQFNLPRARGYVVHPAARESISRLASLWVQTAVRTIHESIEKVTR
jgi:hypothetical protein